MTINKALKAVNDTMDWTVLLLLLVMVRKEHRQMLSFVVTNLFINPNPVNKHPIPIRG